MTEGYREFREFLTAWGVPDRWVWMAPERCRGLRVEDLFFEYGERAPEVIRAVREITSRANWYAELESVIVGMALARDTQALRSWNRKRLVEAGWKRAGPDDAFEESEEYADEVIAAIENLAELIEDAREEARDEG